MIRIVEDDLTGGTIVALLRYHIDEVRRNSPINLAFVLNVEQLQAPDVTFWSLWEGETLAGCAALKRLSPDHCEVKSMRTAQGFRHTSRGASHRRRTSSRLPTTESGNRLE